jgi:GrpB-like predicted nucleotidyltransferase (UPF0157 family)
MQRDVRCDAIIGGIEKREIVIVEYDPTWQTVFQAQSARIRDALSDTAVRIEHIGSTSVPGLAAKPIVDMLLIVADSSNEASYLPQLEAAGYVLRVREAEFDEHRMFRTPTRDVHIHVFSHSSGEIERYLLFQDRLRRNPEDRQAYEETKRKLAAKSWPHMDAYANAKSDVIEQIIASARADRQISRQVP